MKIEICKSLIETYLKLEKKCFIVQKNWKPAKLWDNDEKIIEKKSRKTIIRIISKSKNCCYFEEKIFS